ncbi:MULTISPECIES: aldo/keto reductase family oxidoreductase [unclassified Flavobacterium]|uniref:aldo/keto reductase n=1 Tax=unclassified Flavobacterium TaxID=196869 RepID=UPI001291D90F|nr:MULTISPECIES: aldo/keto reductase [unclassified Flavobacterium]MQP51620.1 aldo/keto reductase [Flavobacterium sp. LMO9]MQP61152.1 aldo/keto reductase [Flavobacterium sp. LMO6]
MSVKLSPIIAGVMNWGVWDKNLNTNEMNHLIHLFLENGITTFDHADLYGGYTTEAAFGKALASSKMDREKIQLITKCGIQYVSENRPKNVIKHYDYSKEYIIWSVENSLKNLQTDYLDVFLLHRPSPLMQADEVAEAVEKLKAAGKILSFGVSNFTSSQTELLRQKTEVSFNQIQFSATNHEAMLDGSLDYMQLHKITPMAWNPLGVVFRENTEQTQPLKLLFSKLVDKYHVGADLILLAWILQHPANILPVAGTINVSRIQQLMKAKSLVLDKQDWFAIWTESMGNKVP